MTTATIIEELEKLPLTDKLLVIERTLKSIRQHNKADMTNAVDTLYNDYKNDDELTAFSQLDSESFYEAK